MLLESESFLLRLVIRVMIDEGVTCPSWDVVPWPSQNADKVLVFWLSGVTAHRAKMNFRSDFARGVSTSFKGREETRSESE